MFSSSGSIGGWVIDTNQLSSGGIVLGGSNASYTLRTNKLIAVNDSDIKATTINVSTTRTTGFNNPENCRSTVAITGLVRIIGFSVSDMDGNCAYYTDVKAYKDGSNIVAVATISANNEL
jgi:hypothetical protein